MNSLSEEIQALAKITGNDKEFIYSEYSQRQLKVIMDEMKRIEETVNPNWPEEKKASYIYDMLSMNGDISSHPLLGQALFFKHMMDRQGIKCDYVRENKDGKLSTYNVVTTEKGIITYSDENMKKIKPKIDFIDAWNKKYQELISLGNDSKTAQELTHDIMKHYLTNGNTDSKDSSNLHVDIDGISHGKVFDSLIDNYIAKCQENPNQSLRSNGERTFRTAILETMQKYGLEQARKAVRDFAIRGNAGSFTNDKRSRTNLEHESFSNGEALDCILGSVIKPQVITFITAWNKKQQELISSGKDSKTAQELTRDIMKHYLSSGNTDKPNLHVNIDSGVTHDEVLDSLIDDYVARCQVEPAQKISNPREVALRRAIRGAIQDKHNPKQVKEAVRSFVLTGKFRSEDRGIEDLRQYTTLDISNGEALGCIIDSSIPKTQQKSKLFSRKDFEKVSPPRDKSIFSKTMNWIKDRLAKVVHNHFRNEDDGR